MFVPTTTATIQTKIHTVCILGQNNLPHFYLFLIVILGRGLEEAQDILEFNQHLDKIEAWIRDKEMMVSLL